MKNIGKINGRHGLPTELLEKYSLCGRTVALSGATGGIGRELCKKIASLGGSLILLDRSRERSEALIRDLCRDFPDLVAKHITLDLEDMERVRAVAELLEDESVDFLILNAGAYSIPRHNCASGYDNVFQINFLSPYVLMRRLLPTLEARGGKAVVVGSIAHRYSKTDMSDIEFKRVRGSGKVYGNAKRFLMFSAMAQGGQSGAVCITHPGIAVTNITAHYPKWLYTIIKYPMKIIFMHPKKACLSILAGLFEDSGEFSWIGPRVFDVWGLPKKSRLRGCTRHEAEEISKIADVLYQKTIG